MTDLVIFTSPFGTLAFSPTQVKEAVARANESAVALCCEDEPTSTPETGERWLTVAQIASRMNLPRSYLYEGLNSGEVPGRKFGRFWRIPESYTHRDELLISGSGDLDTGNL